MENKEKCNIQMPYDLVIGILEEIEKKILQAKKENVKNQISADADFKKFLVGMNEGFNFAIDFIDSMITSIEVACEEFIEDKNNAAN